MWTRRITLTALGISFGLLGYAEYRAVLDTRKDDTISEQVWDASKATSMVPFVAGFIMGHFFWQRNTNK